MTLRKSRPVHLILGSDLPPGDHVCRGINGGECTGANLYLLLACNIIMSAASHAPAMISAIDLDNEMPDLLTPVCFAFTANPERAQA
jgi:hypothetical protein